MHKCSRRAGGYATQCILLRVLWFQNSYELFLVVRYFGTYFLVLDMFFVSFLLVFYKGHVFLLPDSFQNI